MRGEAREDTRNPPCLHRRRGWNKGKRTARNRVPDNTLFSLRVRVCNNWFGGVEEHAGPKLHGEHQSGILAGSEFSSRFRSRPGPRCHRRGRRGPRQIGSTSLHPLKPAWVRTFPQVPDIPFPPSQSQGRRTPPAKACRWSLVPGSLKQPGTNLGETKMFHNGVSCIKVGWPFLESLP